MTLRRALTGALCAVSLAVLCGCSAPADTELQLTAEKLQGIVFAGDLPSAGSFDLVFASSPMVLQAETITTSWSESGGTPDACFPSYAATYLAGDAKPGDNDEYVDIAGYYPDDASLGAVSVSGRSFENEDAASAFLEAMRESAADCTAAGGYQLFDGEGTVGWSVTSVDVTDLALDLPAGVSGIQQQEQLDQVFAQAYRVTLLQRGNVLVAVMAQVHSGSSFTLADVDALVETIAPRLAALK